VSYAERAEAVARLQPTRAAADDHDVVVARLERPLYGCHSSVFRSRRASNRSRRSAN